MLSQERQVEPKHSVFRFMALDYLWWIIGLGVLIRLVFIGLLNLLPEEAYYWNYACPAPGYCTTC